VRFTAREWTADMLLLTVSAHKLIMVEEYAVMADQWYRYAEGFLLVYSITDRQSFVNLNKMHKDILRVKERGKKDVACIVVSQKVSLGQPARPARSAFLAGGASWERQPVMIRKGQQFGTRCLRYHM
jgi:chromosome condensin MukBEF complex kleisin-like MukF subunit